MLKLLPPLLCLLAAAPAQALREGYHSHTIALPAAAGNVLALPNGHLVWFDGQDLVLLPTGGPPVVVLHFATPVFGSFTIAAGAGAVLFGESSTNGLWLVPLHGTPPGAPLTNVVFNYDAVAWTPGLAIVSAKTGGFGSPDNELVAVDLASGQTRLLARLPGASGPVTVSAAGDLYYATASLLFPTPPGQTNVLRFRRPVVDAALVAHQVLGVADGELVFAGLDAASDLAFDDDDDLLFVDWWNGAIGELNDAATGAPWRSDLLGYSGAVSAIALQFAPSPDAATFEPFQADRETLLVHEGTFGSLSRLRAVRPAPAALSASAPSPLPAGPFTLAIAHGPALGAGLVAIALAPGAGSAPVTVAGFEQTLWWSHGLFAAVNTHFVSFDANGTATLGLANPGFAPSLAIGAQAAFLDASGGVLGATGVLRCDLGP